MQEVPVRSTTGFLTLFIGLIDFRLSPSNAPDVFGLKTISPSFLSLSLSFRPKPLNPDPFERNFESLSGRLIKPESKSLFQRGTTHRLCAKIVDQIRIDFSN